MKQFTEVQLREVIDKQMEINGYSERFDDLVSIPDWFVKFTTTPEGEEEFKKWLRGYLKPYVFKGRMEKEISWLILDYGLKTIQ